MAAHGGSVLEIRKVDGKWQVVPDCKYARRITADTEMEHHRPGRRPRRACRPTPTRPARQGARHAQQLRRRRHALGHLADVRGELQRLLLRQARRTTIRRPRNYKRYGMPGSWYNWGDYLRPLRRRARSRTRPNRFGWVVEIDPFDPPRRRRSAPRSAASSTRAPPASSTRTAASSSTRATTSASTTSTSSSPPARFDPSNRAANMDLLDDGTLYVAQVQRRRHAATGCRWSTARAR